MKTLGICTWTLGIKNLSALMAKIKALGFNGVQYCEPMSAYSPIEVKQEADKQGLSLIIFDPFDCRPGGENGEASQDNALKFYRKALTYADELGCGLTLQGLSSWTVNCDSQRDAWQFLISCLQQLSVEAALKGVPLAYEPCNLYEVPLIHTAHDYERLMEASGCDDIAILLDSFHMNIGEKNPLSVVQRWAKRNIVFHVSDSNREGIAQGHIDFRQLHQALETGGFDGPCVFEFVLQGNPVNTPPRNEEEMARLEAMLRESRQLWQSYAN